MGTRALGRRSDSPGVTRDLAERHKMATAKKRAKSESKAETPAAPRTKIPGLSGRPVWQGHLRLSLVSCPVALYKATSRANDISFVRAVFRQWRGPIAIDDPRIAAKR